MRQQNSMPYKRAERVGDQITQTIAEALLFKVSDPRMKQCTITSVVVSDDLKNAKILFSMIGAEKGDIVAAEKAFVKAAGFFRKVIDKKLKLRYSPELRFEFDSSFETGAKMISLIEQVVNDDESGDSEDS